MTSWSGPPSFEGRPEGRLAGAALWAKACALLLAALVALAGQAGRAETRVALVIGNSAYAELTPLKNPVNDATDLALALEGLGFEVARGLNASRSEMIDLIGRFVRAAREADVSLFYYAGHGLQIEARNYLAPVDAALRRPEDVGPATIGLDEVTGALAEIPGAHLVFLDACRTNPLAETGAASVPLRDGLARIGDAAGFLFAFATQPDNVAYDGAGRNSFFTGALLGHLATPGQDIASTMIEVRKDVLATTGGRQVPWENSSLTRQFTFVPGPPAASAETLFWQVAATTRERRLLEVYLDRYAQGAHAAEAREMLAALPAAGETGETGAAGETGAEAGAGPGTRASLDRQGLRDQLWEIARRTRLRSLVEVYLEYDPDGPHAPEARRMLDLLPPPADRDLPPEILCDRLATHIHDGTAQVEGVPLSTLARNAGVAREVCAKAAAANPDLPHYTALLGRVAYAANDLPEAVRLYRDAADRGDLRAMFSLARLLEAGEGLPKDTPAALALYEASAAGGNADSAINLAIALYSGQGIAPDPARARALLERAVANGSGLAVVNLGGLAEKQGDYVRALALFRQAAALGETDAYVSAAILLDDGRGTPRDPQGAADFLLRAVAADYGKAFLQLTDNAGQWRADTIAAVQTRLQAAGFYDGAIDGSSGPQFAAALLRWRNGGFLTPEGTGRL